jgi:hypothetical protein
MIKNKENTTHIPSEEPNIYLTVPTCYLPTFSQPVVAELTGISFPVYPEPSANNSTVLIWYVVFACSPRIGCDW